MDFIIIIILAVIVSAFIILGDVKVRKLAETTKAYRKKDCLMTNTELKYFNALRKILNNTSYVLLPQMPLCSFIERTDPHKFQSELNRVADFVVFSSDYAPLLVIEINDWTHKRPDRIERDKKVGEILNEAKLPLMTIWTDKTFNTMSFAKEMKSHGLKIDLSHIYNGDNR